MNTNINDYTKEELITLLEIPENYTKEEVIEKINFLNENYFDDNEKIKDFFNKIQNKLINEIYENQEENLLPDFGNNIETMENMENSIQTNNNQRNSNNILDLEEENISYNIYDLIKQDKDVIENYFSYNYLHFNTIFRSKNNSLLETRIPPTNSDFILSTPINNISRIKLSYINIKKPYLISNYKSNNKFIIKKYRKNILNGNSINNIEIEIEDGYYEDTKNLEDYLNNKYFYNSSYDDNTFNKHIQFSINQNSKKIVFEVKNDYFTKPNTNTDSSFSHFILDFKTNYTKFYSLATILGFDYNNIKTIESEQINENNTIISSKITSPYCLSNKGDTELFFCLDEYQSNIVETHKLFFNNNMSTQKILARINSSLGNKSNNYYINETYSVTDTRNDHIRGYDGLINLLNFNIKIIDYYGNVINTDEDFTFTLEVKINNSRLIKNKV